MASAGQSQAFMPSPNDSLVSHVAHAHDRRSSSNSNYTPRAQSMPAVSRFFSQEQALLSPSDVSDSDLNLKSSSKSNHWQPPGREQVPSASQVPGTLTTIATLESTPSDEGFWYGLYNAATEVHEKEREVWKRERIRLMQEVHSLKDELARVTRANSGAGTGGGTGGGGTYPSESTASSVGGKENDKIFYNPQTVRNATEKLRQYSVVSPKSDASNSGHTSRDANGDYTAQENSGGTLRRTTSFSRGKLSSISEDSAGYAGANSSSAKRVSISDILAEDEARMSPTRYPDTDAEHPTSPPQTALLMTPPPANFIMHAGHTPLAPRARSNRDSFDMGKQSALSRSAIRVEETSKKIMRGILAENEDPELASPKFLPSEPKGDVPTLTALDQLLQDVAEHPEENAPEVLRTANGFSSVDDSQSIVEGAAEDTSSVAAGGIRLKTSRSLNFGAELGSLR